MDKNPDKLLMVALVAVAIFLALWNGETNQAKSVFGIIGWIGVALAVAVCALLLWNPDINKLQRLSGRIRSIFRIGRT